jgi:hypothetical protein
LLDQRSHGVYIGRTVDAVSIDDSLTEAPRKHGRVAG